MPSGGNLYTVCCHVCYCSNFIRCLRIS